MSLDEFQGPPGALVAPGMTMRYTISLGQDHAVQFETFFDRDSEPEMRRSLLTCFREGNRLMGRNQLPILRRQLEGKQQQLDDNKVRKAEVEAKLAMLKTIREGKVLELTRLHRQTLDDAQNEWRASGRRGEFKATGHVAGTLERLKAEIEQLASGQAKDDGDGPQQLAVLDNEIKEGKRAIAQLEQLVAEAEAMALGKDVSGLVEE